METLSHDPRPSEYQHASWFVPGAQSDTRHLFSSMNLVPLLDTTSVLLPSFFTSTCVVAAILWLTYRAYLVLSKPLDELVGLLGFELPQGPLVDLATVKADGLTLHWKPIGERRSANKYDIQVNGTVVGEVQQSETSIILCNLQADHNYIVRVVTVNSLEFRAASEPIRIRTKPASSLDFYHVSPAASPAEGQTGALVKGGPPVIRPFKTLPETYNNPLAPPPMARETSNGPGASKRIPLGRRPSPAVFTSDLQHTHAEETAASEETQQQLTRKLEEMGKDTSEAERQLDEEEQEATLTKTDLARERDELRASLKEKENVSRDLRKQVNVLERENGAAQGKRTAQDRALKQRQSDMQKVKDDSARWARESEEITQNIAQHQTDKDQLRGQIDEEKLSLQDKLAQEVIALKSIEDEIKDRSNQVKKLERENNDSPVTAETNEQNDRIMIHEAEEDRLYQERMAYLEEQYKIYCDEMEGARRLCQDAFIQLQAANERQRQLAYMPRPASNLNQPISRTSSLRQPRRTTSGPNTTNSSSVSGFHVTAGSAGASGMSALPEGFPSPTPFFNINNGMTLDQHMANTSFTSADVERLTGGALMSPGVGAALLPAGLLNTADEDVPQAHDANVDAAPEIRSSSNGGFIPGLGAFSSASVLPGLGANQNQTFDITGQGPASPASVSSRSPSVFASPRASSSNLAFQTYDRTDGDGRSIRSARSIRAGSNGGAQSGSRFAQILGFNRQRGKTVPDDGLALGSLSKSQSQSVPRDAMPDDAGSASNRRRNSSHSGNFLGNVLRGGSSTTRAPAADGPADQSHGAVRRRPFQVFGGRDGWPSLLGGERPISPRPGSTHSTELPRPSHDNTGWGVFLSNDNFPSRSSPLSTDWGQAQPGAGPQPRIWGSRHPSRRPSVQVGESGNVPYDIMEGDSDGEDDDEGLIGPSVQAPIGTRPSQPIERPLTPQKLNPAAKDFKSLFSFGDKKDKPEKASKSKGKDKDLSRGDTAPSTPNVDMESPVLRAQGEHSPPRSRMSKDTRSITTADSSIYDMSSRDSLERTPSQMHSDLATPTSYPGSAGKESFMSKLSRKSSSGKFGLPVFQKKTRADKTKDTPQPVGEEKEAEEYGFLSQSMDSISRGSEAEKEEPRPRMSSSRTWSAMFTGKIGKGKNKEKNVADDATPSVSGASMTSASEAPSEATDDMRDDEV